MMIFNSFMYSILGLFFIYYKYFADNARSFIEGSGHIC